MNTPLFYIDGNLRGFLPYLLVDSDGNACMPWIKLPPPILKYVHAWACLWHLQLHYRGVSMIPWMFCPTRFRSIWNKSVLVPNSFNFTSENMHVCVTGMLGMTRTFPLLKLGMAAFSAIKWRSTPLYQAKPTSLHVFKQGVCGFKGLRHWPNASKACHLQQHHYQYSMNPSVTSPIS